MRLARLRVNRLAGSCQELMQFNHASIFGQNLPYHLMWNAPSSAALFGGALRGQNSENIDTVSVIDRNRAASRPKPKLQNWLRTGLSAKDIDVRNSKRPPIHSHLRKTRCGSYAWPHREGAPEVNGLLSDYAILDTLHRLPESVALTPDEAAIFLRMSMSTLERLRRQDSGPTYMQGGQKGAKGVNQKCSYLKRDLIKYQESLRVTSSMGAAVRRGQAFLHLEHPWLKDSAVDLARKRPFYIDPKRCIIDCVDDVTLAVALNRIGSSEIAWFKPIQAASQPWSDHGAQLRYVHSVRQALNHISQTLQNIAHSLEPSALTQYKIG